MNTFFSFSRLKFNRKKIKGFSKNPFFYFGVISFVLFGVLCLGSGSLAGNTYLQKTDSPAASPFFKTTNAATSDNLFFSQNGGLALETPDLKIIQDNSVSAISTPSTTNAQTLGSIFGGSEAARNGDIDYEVQIGDTMDSLAAKFQLSKPTIAWANEISQNATLKVGQVLIVPPVDGVFYNVKSGDTIFDIAKRYKSTAEKIIAFNNLKDEGDIFSDDVIFLPDGKMPTSSAPSVIQIPIADSFFIYPTQGHISQGPHGFLGRGIDVANACGTPVYAAASGVVQRSQFNPTYGNFVTMSHSNGTSTYYGHLQSMSVRAGEAVVSGQMIGFIGRTGTAATGCHLHFEVRGAKNFLTKFGLGALVSFK
ncbi:M23 family metallopeptidase [Candidatus Parcubacteria bacterium]|nr:M23 family metallopeptidase [Candidatus Parcubacteria bacterium]